MTRPRVSVMLPCFDAADTLPRALASVAAQTLGDWECICVDDGSADRTWDVLRAAAARDARFKLERFPANRGRGAARQRALELATGAYLAFLDADDWMYPAYLACGARWLDVDARIAAASVCGAVTDGPDRAVGVLRPPTGGRALPIVAPFERPAPPPLLFPLTMIRTDLAQRTGFDPAFKRSEDADFLIRALLGRHYALAPDVLYAYSQASAATLARTLEGYRFRARSHLRHARRHPWRVARTLAETGAKYLTYRAAGAVGAEHRLIARRWGAITDDERRAFDAALAAVRAVG